MKYFRTILLLLLPWLGNAAWAQIGIAVTGDCGVSGNTSILVASEQLTLKQDVRGSGSVIMGGTDTQTIVSEDRAIDRLVIANPKAVKVKGKLTVKKSLTVEKGDLVVEPKAQLVILPNVLVRLAAGSKKIYGVSKCPGFTAGTEVLRGM